jgi:peptidoglycan/LPS O-acetylase OafA/YrhL
MSRRQAEALLTPTPAWRPGQPAAGSAAEGRSSGLAALPSTWIDLAKALASQLIVWHHLSLYGPMCDVARSLAPTTLDLLNEHARLVVQVFLVVGGFLAASSLWPTPGARSRVGWRDVPAQLWRRYQRLARPYLLAMLAVIVAAWVARNLMEHPTIPAAPEPGQLAAHILLLQDVMGFESLSAGFWYVAVDFQLYALLLLLAVALRGLPGETTRRAGTATAVVLALVLLSLLWWNLDSSLDAYAPYFIGAYGMGVLARWVRGRRGGREAATLGLAVLIGVALVVEWRSRIALAGATALLLCLAPEPAALRRAPAKMGRALIAYLSRISYPVFLLHYPVILVTGAVVNSFWPESVEMNGLGMLVAWALSLVAGSAMHRAVEAR